MKNLSYYSLWLDNWAFPVTKKASLVYYANMYLLSTIRISILSANTPLDFQLLYVSTIYLFESNEQRI